MIQNKNPRVVSEHLSDVWATTQWVTTRWWPPSVVCVHHLWWQFFCYRKTNFCVFSFFVRSFNCVFLLQVDSILLNASLTLLWPSSVRFLQPSYNPPLCGYYTNQICFLFSSLVHFLSQRCTSFLFYSQQSIFCIKMCLVNGHGWGQWCNLNACCRR